MKKSPARLVLIAAAILIAGCSSSVTPAKLGQVSPGMKTDQVEALLGQPTRIEQSEITGLTGEVYHYVSRQGDGRVVFVNGAVFSTQFVPEIKSS